MLEALVLVRVNKDNLKELSKPKESNSKILLKINKLRKKSIKTKKAILVFSGRRLDDGDTLESSMVQRESILHLMISP